MTTARTFGPDENPPLHIKVASTVRAELARVGLRQIDLARALGMTQQAVSARLRGATPFGLSDLEVLSEMLGISPADLVAGTPGVRIGIPQARTRVSAKTAGNDRSPQSALLPIEGSDRLSQPECAWRDSNPQPSDP